MRKILTREEFEHLVFDGEYDHLRDHDETLRERLAGAEELLRRVIRDDGDAGGDTLHDVTKVAIEEFLR